MKHVVMGQARFSFSGPRNPSRSPRSNSYESVRNTLPLSATSLIFKYFHSYDLKSYEGGNREWTRIRIELPRIQYRGGDCGKVAPMNADMDWMNRAIAREYAVSNHGVKSRLQVACLQWVGRKTK